LRYLFEDFALDTDCRELLRGADPVPVEPQVFDLLVYLICNRERVVSRDDLLASVWQGRIVSESALNTRIHMARSAVGDTGEEQRLIKTFPRKGLRFVGPVREDLGTAGTVAQQSRAAAYTQLADAPARDAPPCGADLFHVAVTPEKSGSSGKPGTGPFQGPQRIVDGAGRWRGIVQAWQALEHSTRRVAATAGNPAAEGEGGTLASGQPSVWSWLAVAALSTVLVLGAWMLWPWPRAGSPPSVLAMMAAPTIAVLPFATLGSQNEPHAPALGLEAEVRSELARAHRGFDLIIQSGGDNRHRLSPPKVAAARLGARYVVVGTMWLDGEVQRANVQIIEAETDRQIWSAPFELNRGQSGAINRLAARIARLIVIQVRTVESRRPLPARVEAGHYVLQGRALHETERGAKSTSEAQALFKKALQLDPNSASALQGFATTRLIQVHNAWVPREQRRSALLEAEETIERLVKLDPGSASGHYLRASLLRALGDVDKGIASAEHALSLNPNYFAAHGELGRLKIEAGRAHEAIGHIQDAIELNPPEPNVHVLYFWAGFAALHVSDDQTAVQWLLKARQANPALPMSRLYLAAAYLGIGEEERARASLAEFLKVTPGFSLAGWKRSFPAAANATVVKQRERIRDAWRRLGVPEDEISAANR
jgi:adenylate cyclase